MACTCPAESIALLVGMRKLLEAIPRRSTRPCRFSVFRLLVIPHSTSHRLTKSQLHIITSTMESTIGPTTPKAHIRLNFLFDHCGVTKNRACDQKPRQPLTCHSAPARGCRA
ncbi:hypothetical protein DQ04_09221010 [Trypanosoma grayi]|uniref:hypothetical protein n=1 Tax=Trypanosoma grayi TaxID=71804 RepID=UPI0004F427D0|nr:hypothetical protein DQ04_09221010 [Trypanosoma grayi]KEG07633.1 hypothetical protein DQ04_09221010 [Trypanosoma grayi]